MTTRNRSTDEILTAADGDIDARLKAAHIDLDIFLACDQAERARRWRECYSAADKHDLVAQMLERRLGDWEPDEVAYWIQRYDAKYGATDRAVPEPAAVLAVAAERRATAAQHEDVAGVRQLDRVRMNLLRGAHVRWHLGDLLIASVNTPGAVYAVNRRGCSCPNGAAGRSDCWHVALYDLLLDMQQAAADAADTVADAQQTRADFGKRLAAARAQLQEAC